MLGSTPCAVDRWSERLGDAHNRGVKVFLAHGEKDETVPAKWSHWTRQLLVDGGAQVSRVS